jgi:signal transduction histidine kinase
MNFISNSIKFTPKNGRIKISLKVMKEKIFLNQISMKDIDPIIDSQESLISEN